MEKTIEEIREAVLAECERLCPESTKGFWHSISAQIKLMHHPIDKHRWSIDLFDGDGSGEWLCSICWIDDESEPHEIDIAYRLLGLEARDAVNRTEKLYLEKFEAIQQSSDIEREMSSATLQDLKAERARAAKLVEALEKIGQSVDFCITGMIQQRDNPQQEIGKFLQSEITRLSEAMEFLEAYKKGGPEV